MPESQPMAGVSDLAALSALSALSAKWAEDGERQGRLAPPVAEAIRHTGLARHFVPTRWGGTGGGFTECLHAVLEISRGDASAGWVAAVAAALGRMAAFLPEEAQEAVWGVGPDALLACSLVPGGTATAAPGGWRLSGRWDFLSGVHHADHVLVCCPVPLPGGAEEVRFLLVPRPVCQVRESWTAPGMCGTGSDSVILSDLFVPAAHSFARSDVPSGSPQVAADACHTVPLRAVSGLSFAAPALGAAQAAHEWCTAYTARSRQNAPAGGVTRIAGGNEASVDLLLARTAQDLDSAAMLLDRSAAAADSGALTDPLHATRAALDHAHAAHLAANAVNALFLGTGTSAQSTTHPLQRIWRDVNVAAAHAGLRLEPASRAHTTELYARATTTVG